MSFKEVKELRTSGKLSEALAMAQADLDSDPLNIWNKRSISWVYYEFVKRNASLTNYNDFKLNIEKILDLELMQEEATMLHDNVAIQIGTLVYVIYREQEVDFNKVNELFELAKKLLLVRPSKGNSFLMKAFLKGNKTWTKILDFVDYFGFESFQESDYKSEEYNGRAIASTVEKFFNSYSKKLIDSSKDMNCDLEDIRKRMNDFLPILDKQIAQNSDYQFLPYFKAKILISLNRKNEVLESFLSFAKRKKSEFWVWEVIAETFEKTDDKYFACFCKALSLKSPQEFLIGIRKDFANLLISKGMYSEAKFEILKIIDIRNSQKWKITNDIVSLTNQQWFSETTAKLSNTELYKQYVSQAEAILFQSVEEEIIVVEFVNHDKQILNFIKNKSKHGFFSYKGLLQKPKVGDLLKVRFNGGGTDGFYKVLSLINANEDDISEAISSFEGHIRIKDGAEFGFVNDIFIDPKIVKRNNYSNNQEISGKALLTFNKKKNVWGWKMI
jgi:hypothetical protein